MRLDDCRWIKNEKSGEIVCVVPLAVSTLLKSRPDILIDFPDRKSLEKLIAGKYRSGGKIKHDKAGWKWLKEGVPDPLRWLVGAHRSAEAFADCGR